jgi:hypothetical protein
MAADMLCFNRAEQREISLALGLRIGQLSRLVTTELAASQRTVIHGRLAECERLVRLIAEADRPR